MSHLLWHGSSVYNGHIRGPVSLTPIISCAVTTCRDLDSNTQPSACEANALTDCATEKNMEERSFFVLKFFWQQQARFSLPFLISKFSYCFEIVNPCFVSSQTVRKLFLIEFGNIFKHLLNGLRSYPFLVIC